jgi:hypothetical protein
MPISVTIFENRICSKTAKTEPKFRLKPNAHPELYQDGCIVHVEFEIPRDDIGEILDVVKTVIRMIGVLQHARQAGAATQGGFVLGGVLLTPSFGFRGENLRSDLHWLYLAMADLYLSPC